MTEPPAERLRRGSHSLRSRVRGPTEGHLHGPEDARGQLGRTEGASMTAAARAVSSARWPTPGVDAAFTPGSAAKPSRCAPGYQHGLEPVVVGDGVTSFVSSLRLPGPRDAAHAEVRHRCCPPLRPRSGGWSLSLSDSALPRGSPSPALGQSLGSENKVPSLSPLKTVWPGQVPREVSLPVWRIGPTSGSPGGVAGGDA